jgi:hypothetical protein
MAGRGPQSFKKRQKEQVRKEKQQEKLAKRLVRKEQGPETQDSTETPFQAAGLEDLGDDEITPTRDATSPGR